MKRVGVIGYGHLGQFLVAELNRLDEFEVIRIWNRTADKNKGILPLDQIVAENLSDIDLVVEVAHPTIISEYAEVILNSCDLFALTVTMIKHPSSFKPESPLKELNEEAKLETEKATVLYEGYSLLCTKNRILLAKIRDLVKCTWLR
ncbi:unnamed protein product [Strongylus vulgaris]|uniref:Aspartate/homoserine dehydrogenase NAD-binding domain-containing protein n=1 Tax=Strongylus vulgaris TaxID=40348 RepID=A0A3P7K370_STRVU|nr:unnamed protein product [Strongylus vulgaris]